MHIIPAGIRLIIHIFLVSFTGFLSGCSASLPSCVPSGPQTRDNAWLAGVSVISGDILWACIATVCYTMQTQNSLFIPSTVDEDGTFSSPVWLVSVTSTSLNTLTRVSTHVMAFKTP